uniref:Uncharacterized protein n=1 Tax=Lygus hesperus TaxID=30085 RepID=A0A146MFR7_LYGHE
MDHHLTWNPHVENVVRKARYILWAGQRMFSKTWGLKPKMILWLYTAVVRPIITYASIVWWPKTRQATVQKNLTKVQRQACLGITGAMPTCPTAAMDVLLDLSPLNTLVQRV